VAKARTIAVGTVTRDVADFETFAKQVSPLTKHGRVEIGVASQAEKTWSDVPAGGSPWHEYTTFLPTFEKFFPHKKMQPFVDAKHVKKNRDLLRAKAKVVKKYGYGASFGAHFPFYQTDAFFRKYPHLRGARCDHPRRSTKEAFALCVDHPESLEMVREMAAELAREVPEISAISISTNDAGAGLCWSDWLYPGPNGASFCKHISTAKRVGTMMQAIRDGVGRQHELDIQMNGNFSIAEWREMEATIVNERFHFAIHQGIKEVEHQVNVGSVIDNPVRGIINPVAIVRSLDRISNSKVTRIGVQFGFNYARGRELDDVVEAVVGLVDSYLKEPAHGVVDRLVFLRKICGKWVGEKRRDELLEALVALDEGYRMKHVAAPRLTGNYCGVSMRHVTRPLVIVPEKLTAQEEAYFLPHVFNPDMNEARRDYIDWHGGKLAGGPVHNLDLHEDPRSVQVDKFCATLKQVASTIEGMGDSPMGELLRQMGTSLRLYACVMRSVNNFYSAGTLRDRNMEKLTGPAHIPPKIGDWTGDPDLLLLNGCMRDELDNATEMISLLEDGGVRQMVLAATAKEEDTFLLGPNIVEQMRKKTEIMERHWVDSQAYMSTPHK
jgi:hypothetical protein